MKPNPNWPYSVFKKAHGEYPNEVAKHGLYGVAFFGHKKPKDYKITTESIWRGLLRSNLRSYMQETLERRLKCHT